MNNFDSYIDLICSPLPTHWEPPTLVSLESAISKDTSDLLVATRQQTNVNKLLAEFGIG